MKTYPRVKIWYERMFMIPEVKEVHAFVEKTIPKFLKMLEEKTGSRPKL